MNDSFKATATAWAGSGADDPGAPADAPPIAMPTPSDTWIDDLALDDDPLAVLEAADAGAEGSLDIERNGAALATTANTAAQILAAGEATDAAPVVLSLDLAPVDSGDAASDAVLAGDAADLDTGRMAHPGLDGMDCGIAPDVWILPIYEDGLIVIDPIVIDPLPPIWLPLPVASDSDGDGVDDTWTIQGSVGEQDWNGDGVIDTRYITGDTVSQDRNGDGTIDTTWSTGDLTEVDSDGDGQIDTWYRYTGWSSQDTDFDGVFDSWTDGVSQTETDTDGDGRADTVTTQGSWSATDADGDGWQESWGYSGSVTTSDTDGDGVFDQRITSGGYLEADINGDGAADQTTWFGDVTETDSDGDGVFETVVKADNVVVEHDSTAGLDDLIVIDDGFLIEDDLIVIDDGALLEDDLIVIDDGAFLDPVRYPPVLGDPVYDDVGYGDPVDWGFLDDGALIDPVRYPPVLGDPVYDDVGYGDPVDHGFTFLPWEGEGDPADAPLDCGVVTDLVEFEPVIAVCWFLPQEDQFLLV